MTRAYEPEVRRRALLGWVLSFGGGVKVVRPDSLRAAVVKEAAAMLRGRAGQGKQDEGDQGEAGA